MLIFGENSVENDTFPNYTGKYFLIIWESVKIRVTVQNSPKNHKVLNSYKSGYSILGKAGE